MSAGPESITREIQLKANECLKTGAVITKAITTDGDLQALHSEGLIINSDFFEPFSTLDIIH